MDHGECRIGRAAASWFLGWFIVTGGAIASGSLLADRGGHRVAKGERPGMV